MNLLNRFIQLLSISTSNKSFIKFLKEFFDVLQMKDIIGKWGHGLV